MSDDLIEVPVIIVIDENGDFTVSDDQERAAESHADNYGGGFATSVYSLTLKVKQPKAIEVPAALIEGESGSYTLEIKAA